MPFIDRYLSIAGITIIGLFLMNCGGTPDKNPMVEKTQAALQEAEKDTLIVKNAPVALEEADEAVSTAISVWKQGKKNEIVDHKSYIAQKRIEIARQTALLNAAQNEVKRAESLRQQVLIDARKAEAEASERRAEQALAEAKEKRAEAEAARRAALEAQKRAEELSKRVNELEAQQTERGLVLTLGDVLFDVDEATLKPGGQRAVGELTKFLNEYEERNVLIEGYTDNTGAESYNQQLSKRRADAVRESLIKDGISGSRIRTEGMGEQYPKASNNTSAGRQQNRRVEVIISDKTGTIPSR